jgi:MATE family multidrug resistance protein
MVARAGILMLVAVDTAMTGHAGAVELAYYGLAMAPRVPMILVGIGLLMGLRC